MVQKSPNKIYKKFILFFAALSILLFSGSHANASDILEQANQAYELKDYSKARELYLKAAEKGDGFAQYRLGFLYDHGEGVPQDYTKAREWYLKAAEKGEAKAQNNLGTIYNLGKGVAQDYTKAREWYLKAAEKGEAKAQYNLGATYNYGEGVAQDYTKARGWYLKAAEQGDADAQYNLGVLYNYGEGVAQDYTKARGWYLKAAEQGDADAQYNLGVLYYSGHGVPQDYTKAREWYLKAAEQGDADAQYNLGFLNDNGLGVSQNYTKAREWYLKAAEQESGSALNNLGQLYRFGRGVPKDILKAISYFNKSAELNNIYAQLNLGIVYEEGIGLPADIDEAIKYYNLAANNDIDERDEVKNEALIYLAYIYLNFDGYKNTSKGIEILEALAKKGNIVAKANLIMEYFASEKINKDDINRLINFLEDDYYSNDPDLSDENYWSYERIFFWTHLFNKDWQPYITKNLPDFEFKRDVALKRLVKLSQNEGGVSLIKTFAESDYFYEYISKDEFSFIISNLKNNLKSDISSKKLKINSALFLSDYYAYGYLEPVNYDLGQKYLKLAADYGHQYSQISYGWDKFIEQDFDVAISYLKQASENNEDIHGQYVAFNNLGVIYETIGKFEKAIKFYKIAAEMAANDYNDTDWPSTNLARIYLSENFGIEKNLNEAGKYIDYAKKENSTSILIDAYREMSKNPQLSLIDFLLEYPEWNKVLQELGWYYENAKEIENAFIWFHICSQLSIELEQQDECENNKKNLINKFPGEKVSKLISDATTIQNKLIQKKSMVKAGDETTFKEGKSYALLIANWDYEKLNDLNTPQKDTEKISEVLKSKYNYDVKLVSNGSRREIINSLDYYTSVLNAEDKLLIFYAGHGKSDEDTSFWLPREALNDDDTDWIEDSTIKRKIKKFKAKNIIIIADACFSGNLTRGVDVVSVDINDEIVQTYKNTMSRVVITSGGDEPILDKGVSGHSIFASAFIDFLKSKNKDFSAQELSKGIYERVLKTSIGLGMKQTPSYGELYNAGHQGPDFVFTPQN